MSSTGYQGTISSSPSGIRSTWICFPSDHKNSVAVLARAKEMAKLYSAVCRVESDRALVVYTGDETIYKPLYQWVMYGKGKQPVLKA